MTTANLIAAAHAANEADLYAMAHENGYRYPSDFGHEVLTSAADWLQMSRDLNPADYPQEAIDLLGSLAATLG
ncbi:MAG TPA: hypothetical protein VFN53_06510 [Acidobacteriaceae bacterium]|nr:hypothetical protein [Acidobacteriaceae bacterium]